MAKNTTRPATSSSRDKTVDRLLEEIVDLQRRVKLLETAVGGEELNLSAGQIVTRAIVVVDEQDRERIVIDARDDRAEVRVNADLEQPPGGTWVGLYAGEQTGGAGVCVSYDGNITADLFHGPDCSAPGDGPWLTLGAEQHDPLVMTPEGSHFGRRRSA